jgi:molybdate transport system substrate-binding protein
VLWSSDALLFDDNETALDNVQIKHLGIPNPKLAPYGVAALQVMQNTQRYSALKSKLVEGKNLSAVYQYVTTGNAQAGFLSMSQIYKSGHYIEGSYWIIPNELYQPIKQDAVVLTPALNSKVVENFIVYLQGERARSIMSEFGYL